MKMKEVGAVFQKPFRVWRTLTNYSNVEKNCTECKATAPSHTHRSLNMSFLYKTRKFLGIKPISGTILQLFSI